MRRHGCSRSSIAEDKVPCFQGSQCRAYYALPWASIHKAVRRLTAKFHEVSCREIGFYDDRIVLKIFDRHLDSAAAEVPVKF